MNNKYLAFRWKMKRIFDICFACFGLLLCLPLFLIISIMIKLDSKGPVYFKQKRIGKNGVPFFIYKFRTMVVDAESLGKQITIGQDSRITKNGYWLRKYKMDELPQLINVLSGDMSFVGPRPEVPHYVDYYTQAQRQILTVRPGITDFASITYRNENELLGKAIHPEKVYTEQIMQKKLQFNLEYIHSFSLRNDIRIIFLTLFKVCCKK